MGSGWAPVPKMRERACPPTGSTGLLCCRSAGADRRHAGRPESLRGPEGRSKRMVDSFSVQCGMGLFDSLRSFAVMGCDPLWVGADRNPLFFVSALPRRPGERSPNGAERSAQQPRSATGVKRRLAESTCSNFQI